MDSYKTRMIWYSCDYKENRANGFDLIQRRTKTNQDSLCLKVTAGWLTINTILIY